MSKEERRIVSYHEVGHALISALQKNSEPVQKITIVPRTMGALGYVMHVPEEEKFLNTEAELRDMLVSLVGGRAAEEVVFDTVTTGAANDIEKATDIARNMVTRYGMSKKFGLVGLATVESQYLEGRTALNCSDETAAKIDAEVVEILKESYEKALALLRDNRDVMDKLAEFLIEKETITGKEFMEIYRREKGIPEPEEKQEEKNAESGRPAAAQETENASEAGETDGTAKPQEIPQVIEMPGPVETPEPVKLPDDVSGGAEAEEGFSAPAQEEQQPEERSASEAGEQESGVEASFSEQLKKASEDCGDSDDKRPRGRFSNGRV